MVLHGPALEKRQGLLFRCVDIGAELFAMAAVCVRAQRDARKAQAGDGPHQLADAFCLQARRRIAVLFEAIASNDDTTHYATAMDVLAGRHAWLEQGVVPAPTEAPAVPEVVRHAAAGR